jgi:hypothetical protein
MGAWGGTGGTVTNLPGIMDSINIQVYPNPVIQDLRIDFLRSEGEFKLELFNAHGNLVYRQMIQNHCLIDMSSFAPGTYLLKISNNQDSAIRHLIKL